MKKTTNRKISLSLVALLIIATLIFTPLTAYASSITFDENGGTKGDVAGVNADKGNDMEPLNLSGNLPTRQGFTFAGFFDAATGGTMYYNADGSSAKKWDKDADTVTLYAQWIPITYTVTFDADGGSTVEPQTVQDGTCACAPTDPQKAGYTFDGWYYKESGTEYTKFDFSTPITADLELKAFWDEAPSPSPSPSSYGITLNNTENGTITVDKNIAKEGDTVTITGTPKDETWKLFTVKVNGSYQSVENNKCTFTMPGDNVTVDATFCATKPAEGYKVVSCSSEDYTYTVGSDTPLVFTLNGNAQLFSFVRVYKVDASKEEKVKLDKSNYDVEAGSTIITLHDDYLDTLDAGEYEIAFVYYDGPVYSSFTVIKDEETTVPEETTTAKEETTTAEEETTAAKEETTAAPTDSTTAVIDKEDDKIADTADTNTFAPVIAALVVSSIGVVSLSYRKKIEE